MNSIDNRFFSKVRITNGCWHWVGATNGHGHGNFFLRGDRGKRTYVYAHRLMYEKVIGPIPDGYVIDHLCENRSCVNPDHLEAVTRAENTRRGKAGEWTVRLWDEYRKGGPCPYCGIKSLGNGTATTLSTSPPVSEGLDLWDRSREQDPLSSKEEVA